MNKRLENSLKRFANVASSLTIKAKPVKRRELAIHPTSVSEFNFPVSAARQEMFEQHRAQISQPQDCRAWLSSDMDYESSR